MANLDSQGSVRFVSWNVKGANTNIKLNRIMTHLEHLKTDIAFLQETHLCPSDVPRLKKRWVGHLFHSKLNCRARGAAILIRKNIAFELISTTADPNGRYVIVSGLIQKVPVVLVCVYAPNWDDTQFIFSFFSMLPVHSNNFLIIGGDFNMVQDTTLDRSSARHATLSGSAKALASHAKQLGLSDPWRFNFPSTKVYSFSSHPHHTYSRIDFFLMDDRLLSKVKSCEYHSIVISDHAPISMEVNLPRSYVPSRQWRFNSPMLPDSTFKDFLAGEIAIFFDINKTPDVSQSTVWEAFKSYLRGQIISRVSYTKKSEALKLSAISEEIVLIDSQYATAPTTTLYNRRLHLQAEFDMLSTSKAHLLLLKAKQRVFETGDKASTFLAYQARSAAASRLITQIKSPAGVVLSDTRDINKTFSDFYSNLYSSECPSDICDNDNPLDNIGYPTLDESLSKGLGEPISLIEIQEAIKTMQNGKSPGPDGYTVEFYKIFSHLICPELQIMYN